jgi:GNAT superfamily N-acetyltransferase
MPHGPPDAAGTSATGPKGNNSHNSHKRAGSRAPNTGIMSRVQPEIRVRPAVEADRPMIAWLMTELWGSATQIVHQTVYRPADLPGLIAERGSRVVGLLTFHVADGVLEVVTLNALERRAGVGTLLMEAAAAEARQLRCRELRLTTTNDNLDALRFYQRRGLRLVALRPGAVDRARAERPEIPPVGDYGIPLRDEIDLARRV